MPIDPIDNNGLDNLDNLNEALNISRALVDNARELHKLHKDAGFELYKSFKESGIDLSKTLNILLSNYSKFENFDIKKNQALKLQERLEKDINLLITNRNKINEGTIDVLTKEKDLAKQEVDRINTRLSKHTELGNTIRARLFNERKIAEEIYNIKLNQLRTEQDALDTSEHAINASKIQLDFIKMYVENIDVASTKMGFLGKILKGLAKIPVLGDIINAEKALKVMNQSALKGESLGTNLFKGGGAMLEGIISKMNLAVVGFAALGGAIKFIIDAMFQASKNVAELAKGVDVSKDRARELRQEFFDASVAAKINGVILGENLILGQKIHETFLAINASLGTAVDFNKTFVAQMAVVRENLGLSEDSQKNLLFLSRANFDNQKRILNTIVTTNEILKSEGKSISSNKNALEGVLKTVGYLRTTFKGNLEEMTKAVTTAQLMGTSLEKVNSIAESLLDFESSISNELTAQLMTGKDINLDNARYYSLTNDINGLMGEIRKNFSSFEEFNKTNRLAADAWAKSLGMSRDELANMVLEQETLYKLTQSTNTVFKTNLTTQQKARLGGITDLQEAMKLVKEGGVSMSQIKDVVGEIAFERMLATDAQTKFNQALEMTKEAFSRLVDGGFLDKLSDTILGLANALAKGIPGLLNVGSEISRAGLDREISQAKTQAQIDPALQKAIDEKISKGFKVEVAREGLTQTNTVGGGVNLSNSQLRNLSEKDKNELLILAAFKEYNEKLEKMTNSLNTKKDINIFMDSYKTGTSMQQAVTSIQ